MNCVPFGHGSGAHQPTSVGRHLLSPQDSGSILFLAISDQTDVGLSSALPLALASSVLPMLRLLTRLTVRSVRLRGPDEVSSVSVFRLSSQDDLGPLCTPAVVPVRVGLRKSARTDCVPFGSSLSVSSRL